MKILILLLNLLEITNKLVNLFTIPVFYSEIFGFTFNFLDLSLQLVLLLDVGGEHIEVTFELLDLLVDFLCYIDLLGVVEHEVFHLLINFPDIYNKDISFLLDYLDLLENVLDLLLLVLEVLNDLVYSLQVFIPINVLWHLFPLSIEIGDHFFLMLKVLDSLFDFLLELLDFIDLVLILHFLIGNALFLLLDFVGNGLLVFVPFFL